MMKKMVMVINCIIVLVMILILQIMIRDHDDENLDMIGRKVNDESKYVCVKD